MTDDCISIYNINTITAFTYNPTLCYDNIYTVICSRLTSHYRYAEHIPQNHGEMYRRASGWISKLLCHVVRRIIFCNTRVLFLAKIKTMNVTAFYHEINMEHFIVKLEE